MSDELRQVAGGLAFKVKSYTSYDVNGYRFHTSAYERSRPNRRTTNSGVLTPGTDGLDYYGRVEEMFEISFYGRTNLRVVIFKCHWFDPTVTRKTPHLGLVEIRQDSAYLGEDVYIVASQATQVYYLSYACQTNVDLKGWYIVHKVSPHGRLPIPNDEDYNFNPNTYEGEFFQEEELEGRLVIDLTEAIGMDVVVVDDDDAADEVRNAKDLQMLDRLHEGNDNDDTSPSDNDDYFDNVDSDNESYDGTCNTF
jgi:hypothetical protein